MCGVGIDSVQRVCSPPPLLEVGESVQIVQGFVGISPYRANVSWFNTTNQNILTRHQGRKVRRASETIRPLPWRRLVAKVRVLRARILPSFEKRGRLRKNQGMLAGETQPTPPLGRTKTASNACEAPSAYQHLYRAGSRKQTPRHGTHRSIQACLHLELPLADGVPVAVVEAGPSEVVRSIPTNKPRQGKFSTLKAPYGVENGGSSSAEDRNKPEGFLRLWSPRGRNGEPGLGSSGLGGTAPSWQPRAATKKRHARFTAVR